MGILKRRRKELTLSRAGAKHRSLLEQPDVYFYSVLKYRLDGKYRNCLALLRPSYLSLRDRKHLENIVATIRLDEDVKFHTDSTASDGSNTGNKAASPGSTQMVKFELHVNSGHGRMKEQENSYIAKHQFKCKSVNLRDLWKAYILALSAGIGPKESHVHLLPGQVMQIERMLEMENKRQLSQRSLARLPLVPATEDNLGSSDLSSQGRLTNVEKTVVHKSKSLHPSSSQVKPGSQSHHKFHKDNTKGTPSYFFENISREMAEAILTMGDMFGNLLMRRSTSYPNSYALSFRSTVSRTTEIFHYEIGPLRKHNSIDLYFEIKMEGRHPKFKCLNDVVKYFIKLTDGTAHCLTTNDLEKIGIKQPPYATQYEPPADYEEDNNRPSTSIKSSPPLPPPPPPPPCSVPALPRRPSSSDDDPNCEKITVISNSSNDSSSEKDVFHDQKNVHFKEPTSKASSQPAFQDKKPSPVHSPKQQPAPVPPKPKIQPTESFIVQRKESFANVRREIVAESVQVKRHQSVSSDQGRGIAAMSNVPPVPPPLPVPDRQPLRQQLAPMKSALKAQPDRKQFAPEKNLFRIALEYEEKAELTEDSDKDGAIKEPDDLASQLKGNVKSRVAYLEPDPDRKAVPNFSRPQKKDFMGELAEKLKIRRQVVEQTCW